MLSVHSSVRPARILLPVLGALCAFGITAAAIPSALAAQAPVDLGSASSFAVLAGSTVTNTGPSVVSGDLGVSPGSAITGFRPPPAEPGLVINGSIHAADRVADLAQTDESSAYTTAAGRSPVTHVPVELGGTTLVGGVYSSATLGLTGTVTLDGDASSVWIFRAGSTLITSTASRVVLTGGADACNVYWQIGSSATLGAGSSFTGTLFAHTAITAGTGATVEGRLFAQTAAITLDTNTITRPTCTTNTPPSSTAPGSSPIGTPSSGGGSPSKGGGRSSSPTATGTPGETGGSGATSAPTGGHAMPREHRHTTVLGGRHAADTASRAATVSTTPASSAPRTGGVATGATTTGTATGLSQTGSNLAPVLSGGLLAILFGAGLMFFARRRAAAPKPRR